MKRSMFLEFLDEEASLVKGEKGRFNTFADMTKMLDARADLIKRVEAACTSGELSAQQREDLLALIRRNALPPT